MVTRNDRRAVATSMRTTRKLTVRHGTPRPAEPPPDDVKTERQRCSRRPPTRNQTAGGGWRHGRLPSRCSACWLRPDCSPANPMTRTNSRPLGSRRWPPRARPLWTSSRSVPRPSTVTCSASQTTRPVSSRTSSPRTCHRCVAAVVDNKVDSHGTVLRAAVVSASRTSAVVLVAVDATVKNTNAPDGRLSHYRIRVSWRSRRGAGWSPSSTLSDDQELEMRRIRFNGGRLDRLQRSGPRPGVRRSRRRRRRRIRLVRPRARQTARSRGPYLHERGHPGSSGHLLLRLPDV